MSVPTGGTSPLAIVGAIALAQLFVLVGQRSAQAETVGLTAPPKQYSCTPLDFVDATTGKVIYSAESPTP